MLRRLAPYLVLLLFPLAFLEAFGFVSPWLLDDLYDHRDMVLARIDRQGLAAFVERNGDPVLGWAREGGRRVAAKNCIGEPVAYAYDPAGARVYPGYDARQVEIVAVGDSYTASSEVGDSDAYPAQLAGALDVQVANHGVGGYGPVQSFLNLQARIERYPAARVTILGIMYENVYRMVNSYRPVLYDKSETYGLKPYMSGGAIVPHPGAAALHDVAAFSAHAIAAFEHDFWAKPRHRFPYSVALLRALGTNYYWFQRVQKPFRRVGVPEYFLAFRSPAIAGELRALLNQYAAYAKSRGLRPVAVFIPRNRHDTQSASRFIEASRSLLDRDLVVTDVGAADVAWDRFNLQEPDSNNICHPTPYGYRQVAEHVATVLLREGLVRSQLTTERPAP